MGHINKTNVSSTSTGSKGITHNVMNSIISAHACMYYQTHLPQSTERRCLLFASTGFVPSTQPLQSGRGRFKESSMWLCSGLLGPDLLLASPLELFDGVVVLSTTLGTCAGFVCSCQCCLTVSPPGPGDWVGVERCWELRTEPCCAM